MQRGRRRSGIGRAHGEALLWASRDAGVTSPRPRTRPARLKPLCAYREPTDQVPRNGNRDPDAQSAQFRARLRNRAAT